MDLKKEVSEARVAALRVLDSLDRIERQLRSAKNWGIVDLFGRGMLSGLIKHSKMDDAQRELRQVQRDLQILQKELRDINIHFHGEISMSGFHKFMDIVFDNVVSDWMTQSRINKSLQEVERVKDAVNDVLLTLNRIEKEA
ncbi:MAG: hypothetical protein ACE3NC_06430 [Candidatus Wallacebacter cryptica]|jgi:hypothetical protein|nr:hypothetical protein [Bacillota bacterium]